MNLASFLTFSSAVIISLTGWVKAESSSLELVQILWRHGDRNPVDPYPLDPYKNESFWPEGYAQLTKKGKQQHLALGKYLRQRYSDFLSESYSPYEIRVEASDVDRTLMSAEADLAGLYPPNKEDPVSVWNEDLGSLWQPIPVHTQPKAQDNLLRMSAPCPRLEKLVDKFNHGPEMARIYKENKEMFQYLSNHSGKPVKTLQDIDYLYDDLFIESLKNYTLPDWAKKYFPGGQFYNLTALSFKVLTWTDEMKRLKAGPLIDQVLSRFRDKVELNATTGTSRLDPRTRLFIYSGHDTTLACFLNALSLFNGLPPPYASAVIIELHKKEDKHFLKIFYRNETAAQPYLLKESELYDFVKETKVLIPKNWEKECQTWFLGMSGLPLAALIVGLLLSVLLVVSTIASILRRRAAGEGGENRTYPYLHLQTEEEEDA